MTAATPWACRACQVPPDRPLPVAMAFQPIVDVPAREVYAYEALVRGPAGQPAAWVFEQLQGEDIYHFDQACRVAALRSAARLGVPCQLSINFLPNAVYEPATCLRATLRTAQEVGFPLSRITFEVTEHEHVLDEAHVRRIIDTYRRYGFTIALDDYGAGHANAGLLLALRPDVVKLDMGVVRGVDGDEWRRALVRKMVTFAREVGRLVIAEGVETAGEARALLDLGITHMQGFYFAQPGFECLPEVPVAVFAEIGA